MFFLSSSLRKKLKWNINSINEGPNKKVLCWFFRAGEHSIALINRRISGMPKSCREAFNPKLWKVPFWDRPISGLATTEPLSQLHDQLDPISTRCSSESGSTNKCQKCNVIIYWLKEKNSRWKLNAIIKTACFYHHHHRQ